MAKTRLNNEDRNVIAAAIIDHKYGPLITESRKRENTLAKAAYDQLYPGDLQRKMKAMPAGSFNAVHEITVAVNGQKSPLSFGRSRHDDLGSNSAVAWGEERAARPVLFKHSHRDYNALPALMLTEEDGLGVKINEWRQAREALKKEPGQMRQKLDAALASYRYFDDLVTAFPQAEAFILKRWRERPEGGSPGVPAVEIKDLARELDLPPDMVEAA